MNYHEPVLLEEMMHYLQCRSGGVYVDATVGGGGYARRIIAAIGTQGQFIGIDQDEEAIHFCKIKFSQFSNVNIYKSNFRKLSAVLKTLPGEKIDGIVFDLGVSRHQLLTAERGFGFMLVGPLDMRMDRASQSTAATLVNTLSEKELSHLIYEYSQERWAKRIARDIVRAREVKEIGTTRELAEIIERSIPRVWWPHSIHPATRTFQALRIAVNLELESLTEAILPAVQHLRKGGRIVVVSYHSLEDRIVKNLFKDLSATCVCPPCLPRCVCGKEPLLKIITRKPVIPAEEEIQRNPGARSAKLRVAEKVSREP